MAQVESWFWSFVTRHMERVPRADWPSVDGEYWPTFRSELITSGVTEDVAHAASRKLVPRPFGHMDGHIKAFLEQVKAVWTESEVAPDDRDAAEKSSRDCSDCHGNGLTFRRRRLSAGHPHGDRVVFYCRCAFGRWLERAHREGHESAREARRRIHDLADHPFLWGDEYRYTPDEQRYITAALAGEAFPVDPAGIGVASAPPPRRRTHPDGTPWLDRPAPNITLGPDGQPVPF